MNDEPDDDLSANRGARKLPIAFCVLLTLSIFVTLWIATAWIRQDATRNDYLSAVEVGPNDLPVAIAPNDAYFYIGSDGSYHYFRHKHMRSLMDDGVDCYKVRRDELQLADEFDVELLRKGRLWTGQGHSR